MKLPLTPPLVEVTPELGWVLNRSFAQPGPWHGPLPAPGEVWRLAEAFDLSCRIAGRVPHAQLAAEVGQEVANGFVRRFQDAAAGALLIRAVAMEVLKRLKAVGVPCVFLKSNALTLSGVTPLGMRRSVDVDILLPAGAAREIRGLLLAEGYRCNGARDGAHQLAPVYHPSGVMVEIHACVKHMRPTPGGAWVRWEDLAEQGLLRPVPGCEWGWVPALDFLAAHALIHGVVQHWRQVGDYPLLRVVADLHDIAAHWQGPQILGVAVAPWLAAERAEQQGRAVFELVSHLGSGPASACQAHWRELGENLFLRHAVASRFDPAYREAVRAASAFWVDGDRTALPALLRKVRNRVLLDRGSFDRRYGVARAWPLRAALRLARPLELAGKVVVLAARYLRYHWGTPEKRVFRVEVSSPLFGP